jgi:hypothetical protein
MRVGSEKKGGIEEEDMPFVVRKSLRLIIEVRFDLSS